MDRAQKSVVLTTKRTLRPYTSQSIDVASSSFSNRKFLFSRFENHPANKLTKSKIILMPNKQPSTLLISNHIQL